MSIYPSDVVFNTTPISTEEDIFKEYAIDFNTMELLYNSRGKNIIVEGAEAVKVWIYNALKTPKGRYDIYSKEYGSDIEKMVGSSYTEELTKVELKRCVTECVKRHKDVLNIEDFKVTIDGKQTTLEFVVNTKYGQVMINA